LLLNTIDKTANITHRKQQKSMKCDNYSAAHQHTVNVMQAMAPFLRVTAVPAGTAESAY